MELPKGLDEEQRLNYVIGLVTRQAAMAEDATFSLLRALNEDFSAAVGQQKMPMMSRVINLCIERYAHDSRLALVKDDAISLLVRVKDSADKRNELVHSLWSVSADPIETRYQTLREMESIARGQSKVDTADGRTIHDLHAVHTTLRTQQISLNFLKFRTVHEFNSYRREGIQQGDPNAVEWYDKLIRGEFNVTDNGFELWDRAFAARLATGR